ncbi:peptidase family M1-domain-containing protein [Kalaharituber pfeilii]|nr:peptidase family M1-domain-containing protein [Kalaharituber pfeilii]
MRNLIRLGGTITRPVARPARSILHPASPTKVGLFSTSTRFSTSIRKLSTVLHCSAGASTQSSLNPTALNKRNISLQNTADRLSPKEFVRYCSHRRMCLQHGIDTETPGSVVDITAGREILPADVSPTNYKLTLEPNFDTFTFEGTVVIDLDVVKDTSEISVNALELKIHSAKITAGGVSAEESNSIKFNDDKQMATIGFKETLRAGSKAVLTIAFQGILNDKMAGFYRSSYKAEDGSTKYLATTQMEPTDARRAFPCFDEPALKATYEVSLIADKNLTCLSNMDVKSEEELPSRKRKVNFNKSPPMSTYLLAFIVGDLRYIETNDFRVPVRVYATPGNEKHGDFSLKLAAKTLKFYEETFDSPFPLPKMDMVAIPDFSAGAMENWGLVTYRVVDLLFDETTSGAHTKQRVAEVVQHELAHQWFGNLVTMDFWDGLWLNEGFATWMSWYSCNVFYPEWKVWEGYVTDNLQSALSLDSLRSSHPIEVPVKRADEINQIFDAISYSKGSCVLRMISKYLGEDVFMEGIRRYLKKHAYGNTQTKDLWASLSDASGKDVGVIMDIWTKKVGYPVITVTEKGNELHLRQNRFLRTADVKPEEDQTLYPIFVGLRTKEGVQEDLAFSTRETIIPLKDTEFFKLNADHAGIYRTSYTPERLTKLGEAAKADLLTVEDRAGMVADAGALAASGYQKTSGLLGLLSGLSDEKEVVVWDEITTRVAAIRGAWIFEDEALKKALKAFQKDLTSPQAHAIGWEFTSSDTHLEQQKKALMFGSAGLAGDEKVIKAALDMFEKFAAGDKKAIHPNIRGNVYAIALENGGEREYDIILNAYRTSTNSDEKNTALRALGRSKNPKCIQRSLDLALSSEVKEQDIYLPISSLRSHKEGIVELWKWAQSNWDTIERKLPPGLSMLGSVVQMVTSGFTSQEAIDDIQKFFGARSTKGFDQGLAQSLDGIRAKAAWLERDRSDVESWLKSKGYLGGSSNL